MSNTTIKTRKSISRSALFKNIAIYSILLIIGFVAAAIDKNSGFFMHPNPHGYIIIVVAALGYFLLGYLIWGVYIPTLESPPGRRKGTYYKKAYALKDALKKNYLLITFFIIGIVLMVTFIVIADSAEAAWISYMLRAILYALCSSYILNWLEAALVYIPVKELKTGKNFLVL